MSTTALAPTPTDDSVAAATTARYRAAGAAKNIEELLATFAPDVTFHSPITDRISFSGHDEMRALLHEVFATIDEISYFADTGDARIRTVYDRTTVAGQPLEQATRLELNDAGQIADITVFFRPLPGLATFAVALAPRVTAAKHGPVRAALARILLAPLGVMTRLGDKLVPWFA
ncbi:MAG TPA: nuclear transport factor 2 family protein [Solirubrobacteraceae bacterium]|nr:nuclear transport factor 2 family protein [Solirubrobacteraceae bacterium]